MTGRRAIGTGLVAALTAGAAWVGISAASADNQQASGGGAQVSADSDRVDYRGWPSRPVKSAAQAQALAERAGSGNDTLTLVTEIERFRFVNVGGERFSTGDFVVFEETVFNGRGRRVIGEDTVRCELGIRTFTCEATIKLDGRGKIRIAGALFSGRGDNVFPVTGGTNNFKAVGGQLKVFDLSGNKTLLVFELVR